MPDRKKIEAGVHYCVEIRDCKGCPYWWGEDCSSELMGDLMAYIRKLEEERGGKDD